MSSTPQSPPETPHKPPMAVDTENLTPKALSLAGPSRTSIQEPVTETQSRTDGQPASEVQVPSTLPHDDHEDGSVNKNVPEIEQIRTDPSEGPAEAVDNNLEIETGGTGPGSDVEAPPMDWEQFENRYRQAIQKANDEEDALLIDFNKYVEAFSVWVLAPAQRDNDRAWKRLKTRQRYVELAEAKLEEKQKHYSEVVQAFQKALELLRR